MEFEQAAIFRNPQLTTPVRMLGCMNSYHCPFLCAVIIQNTTLQLSSGLPVVNSPGSKPGATVFVERVHIHGLSRFRNLGKFAHSVKVKVLPTDSNVRLPNIEVCFHR